ncbi:activator-dependent family glycosyltransferase [Saccharothrix obliqua]|uniref:activator-dependent family glycosyltransferase n=1 Tax=Saccharothrix obliqua TaxID=2861747 RepID=UPI001C5DF868|nr:activator-dependent family glycosyltransferase [Saccharothrix obliqua]MBW4721839.1 activator-dependent family glycosyltransferase [Saccharothrix obliqua]
MRVLFATYAENTHYQSLVPLAWALRTAGHEVRVATQPALVDTVTRSGLTAVPVGEDHRFMELLATKEFDWEWGARVAHALKSGGQDMDYDGLLRLFDEATNDVGKVLNDPMVDDLVDFARAWQPDLVLWENFTLAGAVAARVTGAAHVRVLWGVDAQTRLYQRFRELLEQQPEERRRDPMRDWLTEVLERHGSTFDEAVLTGQWTVDQAPRSMRLSLGLPTIPVRYVPYNGPATVPDWLRRQPERPRVCITPSMSMRQMLGHDPVPVSALEVFADLDVEVVAALAVGDDERVSVPDNVRVVDFVPMHAILPTCSAIAHLGGVGVASTAALNGVPQLTLVSPDLWEVEVRADMVRDLGAGLSLPLPELTPELLRDNVLRLVEEPGFRTAAEKLRQEVLAEPSPNDVVPELERLAARR